MVSGRLEAMSQARFRKQRSNRRTEGGRNDVQRPQRGVGGSGLKSTDHLHGNACPRSDVLLRKASHLTPCAQGRRERLGQGRRQRLVCPSLYLWHMQRVVNTYATDENINVLFGSRRHGSTWVESTAPSDPERRGRRAGSPGDQSRVAAVRVETVSAP